jgi:DEAD/DEAH box helicase domain-containing protein
MRTIVFDLETKNIFDDIGSNDPSLLDMSVVCIWDSLTDEYTSYFETDLPKLWPILEKADVLVGFNSDHFDIPVLNKYYSGDLTKIRSLDILKEVRTSLGRRIKLDTLAEATLGKKKIGHGLDAVTWWKKGELEKLAKYCIEDVRITKEIYDYALKHKKLLFKEGRTMREIPLDTSTWNKKSEQAITHTLPW